MRRLLRWCFNGLCLLSLLACVGVAWLWRRSCGAGADLLPIRVSGEQYVVKSAAGRVQVWGLERGDPGEQRSLRKWLARAPVNAAMRWHVRAYLSDGHGSATPYVVDDLSLNPAVWGLQRRPRGAGFYRPLIEALNDPQRFAVAHEVLLDYLYGPPRGAASLALFQAKRRVRCASDGRHTEFDYNALLVRLPADGPGWTCDPPAPPSLVKEVEYEGPAAGYDPAQIPALRMKWLDALAEPLASARWSRIAVLTAAAPLLWLALRSRRLFVRCRRRRLGLCPRCGYDLTGNTSGVCSECGAAVEAARRVTA